MGLTTPFSQQIIKFGVPDFNEDFQVFWDDKECNSVLDALVATPPPISDPTPIYNLARYEVRTLGSCYLWTRLTQSSVQRLCRRFCHCISILRNLDRCRVKTLELSRPRTIHIVTGFIYQFSRMASSIFVQIFNEIRNCCSAKRERDQTRALMFIVTDHLGEMCKEIGSLKDTLQLLNASVSPLPCSQTMFTDLSSRGSMNFSSTSTIY